MENYSPESIASYVQRQHKRVFWETGPSGMNWMLEEKFLFDFFVATLVIPKTEDAADKDIKSAGRNNLNQILVG